MNCAEFQAELIDSILRREALNADVAAHGCNCLQPECRAAWSEQSILSPAIAAWQSRESLLVVPSFRSTIAEVSSREPVVPKTELRRFGLLRWLAVAVAGVAIVSLVSILTQDGGNRPLAIQESAPPVTVESASLASQDSPSDEAVRELSQNYVSWIQGSTGQITDTVSFVLVDRSHDELPAERPGWLKTLEQRWQPLEDSFEKTLHDLLPETPGDMGNAS